MGGGGHGDVGVRPPEVDPHLEVADDHAEHGQEVGHQEKHDVVPSAIRHVTSQPLSGRMQIFDYHDIATVVELERKVCEDIRITEKVP